MTEFNFITTEKCYSSSIILNDSNIKNLLNNEVLKYSEYINNPKYFDISNYNFETSVENSNDAYKDCKNQAENLNSEFFS